MSTQVDEDVELDLDDLEHLDGDEVQHAICSTCYPPPQQLLSTVTALCGKSVLIRRTPSILWRPGEKRCPGCVEIVNGMTCPKCGPKW